MKLTVILKNGEKIQSLYDVDRDKVGLYLSDYRQTIIEKLPLTVGYHVIPAESVYYLYYE